ncbi:MAG TPA: c-type cytochrome [Gemmatimonadales bacterium]|nr:c-type cytochrome [Gemmatimonadales bacterium]
MTQRLVLPLLALLVATPVRAQWPPERFTNLKVLPESIPRDTLVQLMAGFTRALGVRCTHCHVGEEGKPLATYDFASDEKHAKEAARGMLRLVAAINDTHLAGHRHGDDPPVRVTCATCHRGLTAPRPLQDQLLIAWRAGGIDSALAAYTALRREYYGRAAYDFGEVALVDAANGVERAGATADAVRLLRRNTEEHPESAFAWRSLAEGQARAGDRSGAIASYERAVALRPNDRRSAERLAELRAGG